MSAIAKDLVEKTAELSAAARQPFANSRKVYVPGETAGVAVGMRLVSQADTPSQFGLERNPDIPIYDTSGPYTDPAMEIDLQRGLAPLRASWIESRADTEQLAAPSSTFGRARLTDAATDGLRLSLIHI